VYLQVRLQVQVSYLLSILYPQQLAELRVRDDPALERRVKAAVRLDVSSYELGDISLRPLGLGRETHERRELIRDLARL